jgi:hypothetical protein
MKDLAQPIVLPLCAGFLVLMLSRTGDDMGLFVFLLGLLCIVAWFSLLILD